MTDHGQMVLLPVGTLDGFYRFRCSQCGREIEISPDASKTKPYRVVRRGNQRARHQSSLGSVLQFKIQAKQGDRHGGTATD